MRVDVPIKVSDVNSMRLWNMGAPISSNDLILKTPIKLNRKTVLSFITEAIAREGCGKESVPHYLERVYELPFRKICAAVPDVQKMITAILKEETESRKLRARLP